MAPSPTSLPCVSSRYSRRRRAAHAQIAHTFAVPVRRRQGAVHAADATCAVRCRRADRAFAMRCPRAPSLYAVAAVASESSVPPNRRYRSPSTCAVRRCRLPIFPALRKVVTPATPTMKAPPTSRREVLKAFASMTGAGEKGGAMKDGGDSELGCGIDERLARDLGPGIEGAAAQGATSVDAQEGAAAQGATRPWHRCCHGQFLQDIHDWSWRVRQGLQGNIRERSGGCSQEAEQGFGPRSRGVQERSHADRQATTQKLGPSPRMLHGGSREAAHLRVLAQHDGTIDCLHEALFDGKEASNC